MGSSATTVVQEARDITAGKREQTKEEFTNAINAVRYFTEPKVSVYQKGANTAVHTDAAR